MELLSDLVECLNEPQLFRFAEQYATQIAYVFKEHVGMVLEYANPETKELITDNLTLTWDDGSGAYCQPETF